MNKPPIKPLPPPTALELAARDAADVMRALQFRRDGQTLATPLNGPYTIVMRPGMTFWGDREKTAALLGRAFPECTFTWG